VNAANVMAISPKAGAVSKAQSTRTVSKAGTAASTSQGSFDEALGKAGEEVTGKMAKSPVEAQGSTQGNVEAKEADIKDDMPDGTDAAMRNQQQGKEPKSEKTAKEGSKDAQGGTAREGENELAGEQEAGKLAAQAVVLNFTNEGKAALVAEEVPQQAEPAATVNLQSLLPQSGDDVQKNKNFLAMLSGQQVKPIEEKAEGNPQVLNQQPTATGQQLKPATLLEMQLNNHQLANQTAGQQAGTTGMLSPQVEVQPVNAELLTAENLVDGKLSAQENINNQQFTILDNGKERLDAKGMAPFEQSEKTMPSVPVGKVNDSVMLQQTAGGGKIPEAVASLQNVNVKEENVQLAKTQLAEAGLRMDEVPVVLQSARSSQNQFGGNGEASQQLTEEMTPDKTSIQQSANNEPISMFQQSLNESMTGAKAANEANQPQNVQDDFNVPRQIVEQARLLRRGEDTQMVIKLHPDHLGELTLKVSVSANGAINASFHSDNAQVRAIIENTLVQLKQELNNQGLKVDNVDVYAGLTDGQLPQGEGQQAWQQNQRNSGNGIRNIGNVDDYGEETDAINANAQSKDAAADGVDYRV